MPFTPNDKTKKAYDAISSKYDVGSYDDFLKSIQDPTKLQKVYKTLNDSYDIGDYGNFQKNIGFDSQEVKDQYQQGQQNIPQGNGAIPIYNPDDAIKQIRALQQKANEPDVRATTKYDPITGGISISDEPLHGITDEQKNAQAELDSKVGVLSDAFGVKPETVKQVMNDMPDANADLLGGLVKDYEGNKNFYDRKVANISLNRDLLNGIKNKDPQNYNALEKSVFGLQGNNQIADATGNISYAPFTREFNQIQNDAKVLRGYINQYIDDPEKQKTAIENLNKSIAINYDGNVNGTDAVLQSQKESPYLNKVEQLGLQWFKDTDPNHANFNPVIADPTMLDEDAKIGLSEMKSQLANAGISLMMNSADEHLQNLENNYKKNGALTPDEEQEYLKYSTQKKDAVNLLNRVQNPNDKDYGAAAKYDIQNIAQELTTQKHGVPINLGVDLVNKLAAPVNAIVNGFEQAGGSRQNKNNAILAAIGSDTKLNSEYYTRSGNELVPKEKLVLTPELQKQVDDINKSDNTEDKKRDLVAQLLSTNHGWMKVPADSKFNFSAWGLVNSVGQTINSIASFLNTRAALGGGGLGTFGSAFMTDYDSRLTANNKAHIKNPQENALIGSSINAAVMLGIDAPAQIKNLFGGTAVERSLSKLSDEEIVNIAEKSKYYKKAVVPALQQSALSNAKMVGATTLGQYATDKLNNEDKPLGDYAKEAALQYFNFSLLSPFAILGKASNLKYEDGQRYFEIARNPGDYYKSVDNMLANGTISQQQADIVKQDIADISAIHSKTIYTDNKGKPLSDENKVRLLMNKVKNLKLTELAKQDNPPGVQKNLDTQIAKGRGEQQLIYTPLTDNQLENRKNQIEKLLAPKAEGEKELTDTEKTDLQGELAAINDKIAENEKKKAEITDEQTVGGSVTDNELDKTNEISKTDKGVSEIVQGEKAGMKDEVDREIENTKAAIESAKMDEDFQFEGVGIKQLNEDLKILQSKNPEKYFARRIDELMTDIEHVDVKSPEFKQVQDLIEKYQGIWDGLTGNKEQVGDISEIDTDTNTNAGNVVGSGGVVDVGDNGLPKIQRHTDVYHEFNNEKLEVQKGEEFKGREEFKRAIGEVEDHTGEKIVRDVIAIDKLVTHEDVSNQDLSKYEKEIKSGIQTPIVVEYQRGGFDAELETEGYYIEDGHHRYEAYKKLGYKEVPIVVNESGKIANKPNIDFITDKEVNGVSWGIAKEKNGKFGLYKDGVKQTEHENIADAKKAVEQSLKETTKAETLSQNKKADVVDNTEVEKLNKEREQKIEAANKGLLDIENVDAETAKKIVTEKDGKIKITKDKKTGKQKPEKQDLTLHDEQIIAGRKTKLLEDILNCLDKGSIVAARGYTTNSNPHFGEWDIVQDLKGNSHKKGGIDLSIKGNTINAEGNELVLRNSGGDMAIIPKKDRMKIRSMISDNCDSCLNNYISKLPKNPNIAQDGGSYDNNFVRNTFFNRIFNRKKILENQILNENLALKNVAPLRKFHIDYANPQDAETLQKLGHNPEYISPEEGVDNYMVNGQLVSKGRMQVSGDNQPLQTVTVNHPGQYTTLINPNVLDPSQIKDAAAFDFISHSLHADPRYNELSSQLKQQLLTKYSPEMIDRNGGVDAYVRGIFSNSADYQPYKDEMSFINPDFINQIKNYVKTGK